MRSVANLVVLTVALTACAQTAPAQNSEPPLGPLISVQTEMDIDLPLQRYEVTGTHVATIHEARIILNQRCAARFGTVYTDPTKATLDLMMEAASRRYGLVDAEKASRLGYRVSGHAAKGVQSPQVAGGDGWQPSRLEMLVMTGMTRNGTAARQDQRPIDDLGAPLPSGGCTAETESRLDAGLIPVNPQYLPMLQSQSFQQAEHDSRVLTAWREWSTCMRAEGYHYQSPWEPNDQAWDTPVSVMEVETAEDDLRCRQSTRLTDIWMATESAYQARLIEQHREGLLALEKYNSGRLNNARKALTKD